MNGSCRDLTSRNAEASFGDVRNIGHFGTDNLELTVKSSDDLERVKAYIEKSYEAS